MLKNRASSTFFFAIFRAGSFLRHEPRRPPHTGLVSLGWETDVEIVELGTLIILTVFPIFFQPLLGVSRTAFVRTSERAQQYYCLRDGDLINHRSNDSSYCKVHMTL
jgi:hypothetical protein